MNAVSGRFSPASWLLQGIACAFAFHHSSGRALARLAFDLAVHAPSRGRVEVLRSGQPGMDGGGPTEQDRSEGMASISEPPNERGKSALVTFALFESDSL